MSAEQDLQKMMDLWPKLNKDRQGMVLMMAGYLANDQASSWFTQRWVYDTDCAMTTESRLKVSVPPDTAKEIERLEPLDPLVIGAFRCSVCGGNITRKGVTLCDVHLEDVGQRGS